MKIVHVDDYFNPTAGYQINELLIAGKCFNDETYLITSKDMSYFHKDVDRKEDLEFEQMTGVKIIRLDAKLKLANRLMLKGWKQVVDEINPDIVFIHSIGDFKDLLLWRRKKERYRIIRDCHMSWVASKNIFRHIFYITYKLFFSSIINKTDKYHVVYALGVEEYEYLKKIGISNNKIDFLWHGYNDSIMYYDGKERKKIRREYSIAKDDIVIAYIGKLNKIKRPDIIFNIVDNLGEQYIEQNKIKFLFIGPQEKEYMKEFMARLDLSNIKNRTVIDNTKPFTELRKYYSASDICVFPKETTLSSIHAQVCGCPVVMEDHKSNRERVINNKNLYPIDNISRAALIIKRIIDDSEYEKERNIIGNIQLLSEREYKKQIAKIKEILSK